MAAAAAVCGGLGCSWAPVAIGKHKHTVLGGKG